MNENDTMLRETAERLFAELANKALIEAMEAGQWPEAAWAQCEALGLPLAWVPEGAGGYGVPPLEALELVRLVGRHALPLPLVETLQGNRLAALVGLAPAEGPATVVAAGEGALARLTEEGGVQRLRGTANAVPWARWACSLLILAQGADDRLYLVRLPRSAVEVREGRNLAGEPRDAVYFDVDLPASAAAPLPEGFTADRVMYEGAALRALQLSGALSRVLELSVQYANERAQFGRPIGKFQAIQQNLAVMAGWTVTAAAAADLGAEALAEDRYSLLSIGVAKARTSEAAGSVAAIAHQVHGAMGFTREHRLHCYTRRLWSWRDEFGNEGYWHRRLGRLTLQAGAQGWWPMITSMRVPGAASPSEGALSW